MIGKIGKYQEKTVPMSEIPREWFDLAAQLAKAMSEAGSALAKDMPAEVFEMGLATLISGTMNWNAEVGGESQEILEEEFFDNVRRLRGCIIPRPTN